MHEPIRVQAVRLSSLVHATEESDKIIKAMSQVFLGDMPAPEGHNARGHYGNEIKTLEVRSRNSRVAENFFSAFWRRLSESDRNEVMSNIENYVNDEGRLYLRVDKQLALKGCMKLSQVEPIRVEITFDMRVVKNKPATKMILRKLIDLS